MPVALALTSSPILLKGKCITLLELIYMANSVICVLARHWTKTQCSVQRHCVHFV